MGMSVRSPLGSLAMALNRRLVLWAPWCCSAVWRSGDRVLHRCTLQEPFPTAAWLGALVMRWRCSERRLSWRCSRTSSDRRAPYLNALTHRSGRRQPAHGQMPCAVGFSIHADALCAPVPIPSITSRTPRRIGRTGVHPHSSSAARIHVDCGLGVVERMERCLVVHAAET
jgi:hypothetical protein